MVCEEGEDDVVTNGILSSIERHINIFKSGPVAYVVLLMPQYYFDIVTYSPGNKPDPEKDRIISIQYQKIDFRSGTALQDMVVHKEWESSEEEIVTRFFDKFFRGGQNKWIFIPVGYDLNAIWEIITLKFEEYLGPHFRNKRFHYTIPSIDLQPVVVLLNGGNFIGANLEKFTKEPAYKNQVKTWYDGGEHAKIEENIHSSAATFLKFYAKVKKNCPIILKGGKPPIKPVPKPVVAPAPPSPPKPAPAPPPTPEPAPVTTPTPQAAPNAEPPKPEPAPELPPEVPSPAPFMKEPDVNLPPPPPPPPPKPMAHEPPKPVEQEKVEAHEEMDVHEHDVEEVEEHSLEAAEFAPEAHEVEVHEEADVDEHHEGVEAVEVHEEDGDEHEVVEVEEVEAEEYDGEVHEAVEAVEEHVEAISPKDLKKRKKEEAKRLKLEEKLRKKQQKMK